MQLNIRKTMEKRNPILTITGSDSTGGSGIQADIKTISELGDNAATSITSITVQTTLGIQEFFDVPASIVSRQIEAIFNDVQPQVVKIGMIRNIEVLDVIVAALSKHKPKYILYDTIIYSSSGELLMGEMVTHAIQKRLMPLCHLVIMRKQDMKMFEANSIPQTLYLLDESNLHGYANKFSSAVAVFLNKEKSILEAIDAAKTYVNSKIAYSENVTGRSNELYNEFLSYINKYAKTYSDVHFYAEQLNVSSRYLSQVTKRISGHAPKTIIDKYVLEKIQLELRTTEKPIQEIGNEYGFSSQAHLTKFVKKYTGLTPRDYRKKYL